MRNYFHSRNTNRNDCVDTHMVPERLIYSSYWLRHNRRIWAKQRGWLGSKIHFQITLLIGILALWKHLCRCYFSGLISHCQLVRISFISPSNTCSLHCSHIHWRTPNHTTWSSHLPLVCPIVVSHWQKLSANKAWDGSTWSPSSSTSSGGWTKRQRKVEEHMRPSALEFCHRKWCLIWHFNV